jgi:hypothetical protein
LINEVQLLIRWSIEKAPPVLSQISRGVSAAADEPMVAAAMNVAAAKRSRIVMFRFPN